MKIHILFIDVRHDLHRWTREKSIRCCLVKKTREPNSCWTSDDSMNYLSRNSTNDPTRWFPGYMTNCLFCH